MDAKATHKELLRQSLNTAYAIINDCIAQVKAVAQLDIDDVTVEQLCAEITHQAGEVRALAEELRQLNAQ